MSMGLAIAGRYVWVHLKSGEDPFLKLGSPSLTAICRPHTLASPIVFESIEIMILDAVSRPYLAVLLLSLSPAMASAFSFSDLFGGSEEKESTPSTLSAVKAGTPPTAAVSQGGKLEYADLDTLFGLLNSPQRKKVLEDEKLFAGFVDRELARRAVVAVATAEHWQEDPRVAYLMRQRSEQVLVDTYLRKKALEKLPESYPSAEQVKVFYEQNQAQFRIGERMHLWQIFLPLSADAKKDEVVKVAAEAARIDKAIRAGKLTFKNAVEKYSQHTASRLNDGYMGLLKLSTLRPEIREMLTKLKDNDLAAPVQERDGVHLIKRGALVSGQALPLAQVSNQIRTLLRKNVALQSAKGALNEIRTAQGASVAKETLEEWRLRLRVAESERNAAPK